jgi:hypothetical protein
MAQAKTGFFARLFGKRRPRDDFEPSLAHALGATIRKGLLRATGKELPARCEPLSMDALQEDLPRRSSGCITLFFQDSDTPWLILLMPDDWLRTIAPLAAGEDAKKLPYMTSILCEGAADFLTFGAPASFHRVQDAYSQGDLQALVWRTSGTAPFRIVTGDSDSDSFYACFSEETARKFEASLEEKHAQETLRSYLRETPRDKPADAPKTLKLLAPREFLLGSLYLPPRIECGKQVVETLCSTLSAAPGARVDADAPGVWAASDCRLAATEKPGRLLHWYFFPCTDAATATRLRGTYKEIAGCLFRGALPALAEAIGGRLESPALGLDVMPDLSGRTRYLRLSARMRLASVRMPVDVYIDTAVLLPLLKKQCDPEGVAATARTAVSALPLALALNERLLSKGIPSFPGHFRDPRLGQDYFPFSGFADLVTEHDLSIVLQNHLPRALAGRPLRSLFSWSERGTDAEGRATPQHIAPQRDSRPSDTRPSDTPPSDTRPSDTRQRVVTPHLFDEEKLTRHMTQQMRDAWQREPPRNLGSRDEYLQWNREVLSGLDRAARKESVLLSPRARYILAEMILPSMRAQARKRLEEASTAGPPFATLRTMSAPQVQRFFATQSSRVICLGLVGAEAELAFVRKHVSAARATRLEEDLLLARKQLENGTLEWDEAVQAKKDMENSARMIQDSAKRDLRGGEKRR